MYVLWQKWLSQFAFSKVAVLIVYHVTVSILIVAIEKLRFPFFCKILRNNEYSAKVLPKRIHLNSNTTGFQKKHCQQNLVEV